MFSSRPTSVSHPKSDLTSSKSPTFWTFPWVFARRMLLPKLCCLAASASPKVPPPGNLAAPAGLPTLRRRWGHRHQSTTTIAPSGEPTTGCKLKGWQKNWEINFKFGIWFEKVLTKGGPLAIEFPSHTQPLPHCRSPGCFQQEDSHVSDPVAREAR